MIILLITNKKVFNYLEYNIEVEEVLGKVAEELDDKTIWRHALTTGDTVKGRLQHSCHPLRFVYLIVKCAVAGVYAT